MAPGNPELAQRLRELAAAEVDERPLLRLEYAAIRVGDVGQASEWYQQVLALGEVDREGGKVYLGCGLEPSFDLALVPGGHGIERVAYSTDGEDALDRISARLSDAGVNSQRATDAEPGIKAKIRFRLEVASTDMEVVVRSQRPPYAICSEWGPTGVNGPIGFNHLTFAGGDPLRFSEFMMTVLGFRLSDVWLPSDSPDVRMAFLRVGENHHDTAMLEGNVVGLHHTAFLMRDVGAIATLLDRARRLGVQSETGIVRHMPGNNIAAYVRDPWGNRTELTTDIAVINDPTAGVQIWDAENPVDLYNLWAAIPPPQSWVDDVT